MGTAAFVQFGSIDLHPPPNATGIHCHATFRQQLGNVFIGEWISQVPPHAENDHLARELTSLERIGWGNRHGFSTLPDSVPHFAMEPISCGWTTGISQDRSLPKTGWLGHAGGGSA